MLQTLNGLVLRQIRLPNEGSKKLSLLTDSGIVEAFVNGTNKKNSPLQSAVQPLSYSQFVIFENRGSRNINSAAPIEFFFELTTDIERLALAQYLCEIALALLSELEQSTEPLRLMLNSLYMLAKNKRPPAQIKSIVELRMMSIAGFMPDLVMCRECGQYENDNMCFLPEEGRICCYDCLKGRQDYCKLNPSSLTAMRHIALSPLEKVFSFKMNESSLKMLNAATERYILQKTRKNFTALEFYKELK